MIDLGDLLFVSGVIAIGVGVWFISTIALLLYGGLVLCVAGLAHSRYVARKRRRSPTGG